MIARAACLFAAMSGGLMRTTLRTELTQILFDKIKSDSNTYDQIKRIIVKIKEGVEITPEMIGAGISAWHEYDSRFEGEEDAVRAIFLAMHQAMYTHQLKIVDDTK